MHHIISKPGQTGSARTIFKLLGDVHPHLTAKVKRRGDEYHTQQDAEEGFLLLMPIFVKGLEQEGAPEEVNVSKNSKEIQH